MSNTLFSDLFQKYIQGIASPQEILLLKDFVQNSEYTVEYERLLQEAYVDTSLHLHSQEEMEEVWNSLRECMEDNAITPVSSIYFLKKVWFRYAAVLLLIALTSFYFYTNRGIEKEIVKNTTIPSDIAPGGNNAILTLADGSTIVLNNAAIGSIADQGNTKILKLDAGSLAYKAENTDGKVMYNTVSTPKGGQYKICLPDGSKVWLNAASSIRFPLSFGNERRATITGEVYMEVSKDATKPFIVSAGDKEIRVLGTVFNINAYSDEPTMKTTLLEGAIKINDLVLKPNQAYIKGKIVSTNVEQDIAWKNGVFSFTGVDFKGVMRQLERWYDIEIIYEANVPDISIGGELSKDLSLSHLLKGLDILDVKFKINGRKLIII